MVPEPLGSRQEDLERDAPAEALIQRAIDPPHSPFAEHGFDDVAIEVSADLEHRRQHSVSITAAIADEGSAFHGGNAPNVRHL